MHNTYTMIPNPDSEIGTQKLEAPTSVFSSVVLPSLNI